jgi:hypothetical protein
MIFLSCEGYELNPYRTANKRTLLHHSVLEIQQGLRPSGLLNRLNCHHLSHCQRHYVRLHEQLGYSITLTP